MHIPSRGEVLSWNENQVADLLREVCSNLREYIVTLLLTSCEQLLAVTVSRRLNVSHVQGDNFSC